MRASGEPYLVIRSKSDKILADMRLDEGSVRRLASRCVEDKIVDLETISKSRRRSDAAGRRPHQDRTDPATFEEEQGTKTCARCYWRWSLMCASCSSTRRTYNMRTSVLKPGKAQENRQERGHVRTPSSPPRNGKTPQRAEDLGLRSSPEDYREPTAQLKRRPETSLAAGVPPAAKRSDGADGRS